ncbi:MAG: hypothetical protein QOD75_1869 [Blastocatellia bacterium]|jgi:glycosyltransferase involved in cell wall biosynthesis|nr:hypothetical protein [Blastocatellia bacterium]
MAPRISVIVPLYNKAPYVRRALDSISRQTFSDFEVIVVDDGSTDEGPALVSAYVNERVRLVAQENFGPGGARNRGITEARGEFLAFLDADDEWLPDYLEESVRLLDKYGSSVSSTTCGYIEDPAGVSSEAFWRARGLSEGLIRLTPDTAPPIAVSLLAYMSPCTTLVRATVVRKWGGFYERDHCRYAEDAHLWLKVLLNENVFVNLKPLARIHFEASGPTQTRRSIRPIEPFLIDPEEIEKSCPPQLRGLLSRVLAIRALKTASVLGYWGEWRKAQALVKRFRVPGLWRLPHYTSSLAGRTPIGAVIGKVYRTLVSFRG